MHSRIRGWPVAQICNLLYLRFVIGSALDGCGRVGLPGALQNAILRYSRLQICATIPGQPHTGSTHMLVHLWNGPLSSPAGAPGAPVCSPRSPSVAPPDTHRRTSDNLSEVRRCVSGGATEGPGCGRVCRVCIACVPHGYRVVAAWLWLGCGLVGAWRACLSVETVIPSPSDSR
jgi:hypothetical protein